jgi:competence protein ComEA
MFKKILATLLITSSTLLFAMSISEVNSASKEKLMEINGIGDKKASDIIKARTKGKFKSFDDLKAVKGIGDKMVSNIKNDVKSKSTSKKSTSKKTTDTKPKSTTTKESTKTSKSTTK